MEKSDGALRRQANICGFIMLIYAAVLRLAAMDASGWSMLFAPLVITQIFMRRSYFPQAAYDCGDRKSMGFSDFLMLLALTLGTQLIAQLAGLILPANATASKNTLSTFLYVCLFAPVGEELLFRRLILETLLPYSKKLALFASAFLFALLHGNFLQLPYGFLLGLVLSYAAMRYRFFWAIVLHALSNALYSYGLPILLCGLPDLTYQWVFWSVIVLFAVISLVIMAEKAVPIVHFLRKDPISYSDVDDFFCSVPVVLFLAWMCVRIVL